MLPFSRCFDLSPKNWTKLNNNRFIEMSMISGGKRKMRDQNANEHTFSVYGNVQMCLIWFQCNNNSRGINNSDSSTSNRTYHQRCDTVSIVIKSITNQIGAWNVSEMIFMFTDHFDHRILMYFQSIQSISNVIDIFTFQLLLFVINMYYWPIL